MSSTGSVWIFVQHMYQASVYLSIRSCAVCVVIRRFGLDTGVHIRNLKVVGGHGVVTAVVWIVTTVSPTFFVQRC